MSYKPDRKERHFINHFLAAQAEMGKLSTLLLVNFHEYNHVAPEDIQAGIDKIGEHLKMIQEKYAQQYREKGGIDLSH